MKAIASIFNFLAAGCVAIAPCAADVVIVVGRAPAAAGPTSFSDDFNRADSDSLGANWTEADTDIDIASNTATVPLTFDNTRNLAVYTGTACTTVNEYVKVAATFSGTCKPELVLRYTNSSTAFYTLYFDTTNNLLYWEHLTQIGGTETTVGGPTALTIATGDTLAATITGTGAGTEIRLWVNATGAAPDSATSWGGDTTPDVSFTDNPASAVDTGPYVGICGLANNVNAVFDNFSGGDIP